MLQEILERVKRVEAHLITEVPDQVFETIKTLEEFQKPVPFTKIFSHHKMLTFDRFTELLTNLRKSGAIFEPKKDHFQIL